MCVCVCVCGAPYGLKLCSIVGYDLLIYIRHKIVWFVAICRYLLCVCACVCVSGAPYGLKLCSNSRLGSVDLHWL